MITVLIKATSFILIIAIGYLLKRKGFFRADDFYLISRIVLKITLPAAIVSNFSRITMDMSLLLMCLVGFLCNVLMVVVGYLINLKNSPDEKAFDMINLSGYNIGNFTIPFVQSFLGPVGFAVTSLFDAGNSVMCTGITFTAASSVAGGSQKVNFRLVLRKLFSSIPFDAYIIMTVLVILNIRLPELCVTLADTIGASNAFLALFMIGIGFEIRLDGERVRELLKVMIVRYGIAIILSIGCYHLAPFSEEIRQTLAIVVLGPVASIAPAFTGELKGDVELASAINSMSIVISVVTITAGLIIML